MIYYIILYGMNFIYCSSVSKRWQRSVNLYKNMSRTAKYERRNNTQNNTKTQNRQNRKHIQNKKTNIKRILKNIKSSN